MPQSVLILGATGRFGHHAAKAFHAAGWEVRRFNRQTDHLPEAAMGTDLIVNAWNPAYPDWASQVPRLTEAVIAAAKASGATVLLPGNVYVYGETAPELLSETTPHRAENPLGRIRTEMEAAYGEVPVIILRAGDFLDTRASGNWFDRVIAKDAAKGRLSYPGPLDAPHSWAYLPDPARAAVALAEKRGELARHQVVNFPGYTLTGAALAEAVSAAMGRPVRAKRMSWLPLRALAPVWPLARHLVEMRYLWNKPHRMDGALFHQLLPGFRETPLTTALASALELDVHPDQTVARGRLDIARQ